MSSTHDGLDSQARAAVEELRTITDLVRWGAARLDEARVVFGHGTDNALDEALALVLHAAGLRPGALESLFASRLTTAERRAAVDLIVRRIRERIPAPYLTGRAGFAGLEFACDARALVPRSPIAEWIERGFEPWLDPDAVERMLEIGTGGGAIAVACALAFPNAAVDAVDVSDAALELARENCLAHGVGDRVRLFESDVYAEDERSLRPHRQQSPLCRRRRDGDARPGVPARASRSAWRRAPTASTACAGSWPERALTSVPVACWYAR